jgi:hypothetical protein
MPLSALRDDHPDYILHLDEMPALLVTLSQGRQDERADNCLSITVASSVSGGPF